ncbi:trypsin-like peptidase domain-containing protein [Rubinisphaera brasiliensis]|uniref:Trypsin-like peptidase domain-containing protein n=1 Tax=Rubinisphaera brasiliensis (strain ATCC 49424 / DSM 5305 / JCM 21570 / IAM 15109 / NBRC 103401 / IFAM 1448) TaxID=756272 RepID=F0SNK2_RUBBR|nr:serine protease [Rubinisphaera brasiliensis]ADY57836.1 hypothetical protein Plabr_0206 [Rubinisphaera brasiliensis DSM 5305]
MKHLLASLLLLLSIAAPASAQHEPAVMVRSRLLCPGPVCRPDSVAYNAGNGVIVGKSGDSLFVLTVDHLLDDAPSPQVCIQSQWYPARVRNTSPNADLALLEIQGSFDIPMAPIAKADPPDGAEVIIDGYWPKQGMRSLRTRRIPRITPGIFYVQLPVVSGVSGAGVVYQGRLAGLVHGVTLEGRNSTTLVVSASVIRHHMARWGFEDSPPPQAQLAVTDPPPAPEATSPNCAAPVPGNSTCDCDCPAKMAALERRLNLAVSQLTILTEQAQQDAESSGRDAATQIAALTEQISDIRSDLDNLSPLMERRVILVSDGKITSERKLSPSDPIVLSSKLVDKKATNAE